MNRAVEMPRAHAAGKNAPQLQILLRVATLLALTCAAAELFCGFVLHLGEPYNYPILDANYSFGDFKCYMVKFEHFRHPAFFTTGMTFMYPAPMAVMYEVFYRIRSHSSLHLFVAFILTSFLVPAVLLGRALWRRGMTAIQAAGFVAAGLLLAYPLWFDLKQANLEIGVWILVALGVWAFLKDRGYTAAACFGIAGSMKIFPFVYLGLLLAKRKYREMLFSVAVAAITTLVSLWIVGPNILDTWGRIQSGLREFRTTYVLAYRPGYMGIDHSLFGFYKRFAPHLPPPETLGHILTLYLAVGAVAGVALYFLRIRYLPTINQVMCLCVASILLPPISYDYTLMHLYVPWAMLVLFAQEQWRVRLRTPGLTAAFICFAILMAPETEFIRHGEGFGAQIKAIVLLALMYIALKYPFGTAEPATNAHAPKTREPHLPATEAQLDSPAPAAG